MATQAKIKPSSHYIFWIMVALAIWLTSLIVFVSWFQSSYVKPFLDEQGADQFLDAKKTQNWFDKLILHLPSKQQPSRVVQFWQPDCLCNRFAQTHGLKTINKSLDLGVEHITLIPSQYLDQAKHLQTLNPGTQIITIDPTIMPIWPNSPAVFLEDALSQVQYFGPLGFGAFCTQTSTSVIEKQIGAVVRQAAHPYFNVVGNGCFCPWGA